MERTESINELAAALAKAQGAITNPKKDANNPYFKSKYADLAEVWDSCRKPLSDNGLAIIQDPEIVFTTNDKNQSIEVAVVTVTTMLLHTSGQYISSRLVVKAVKPDIQGIGSAITYARRYALMSLIGIAPEDDDDDGEATMNRQNPQAQQVQQRPQTRPASTTPPTKPPVKTEQKPEVKPEVKPEGHDQKEPETFICEGCGSVTSDIYLKSNERLSEYSYKKLGGSFCSPCGKEQAAIVEKEAA